MTQVVSRILNTINGANLPAPEPIAWLIKNFLAKGQGTILFGQPGVSKSMHAAVICASLWRGGEFGPLAITGEDLKILYVDLDSSWPTVAQNFSAAYRGVGLEGIPANFFYHDPSMGGEDATLPTLEESGAIIANTVKQHGIDLVIVDSLQMFMIGDGNNAQDVSLALRMGLNPARRAGAAVLVIDHATKAAQNAGRSVPTPAGSQAKRAWARVTVAIEDNSATGGTLWSVDKTNFKPWPSFLTKLGFKNDDAGDLHVLKLEYQGEAPPRITREQATAIDEAKTRILVELEAGDKSRAELGSDGTTGRALDELLAAKKITKGEGRKGKYALQPEQVKPDQPKPKQAKPDAELFRPSHESLGYGLDGLNNFDAKDSGQHSSQIQANTKNLGLNVENTNKTVFYSGQDSGQVTEGEL